MKRKIGLIAGIAVIVMAALAFAGYNIYRYPPCSGAYRTIP